MNLVRLHRCLVVLSFLYLGAFASAQSIRVPTHALKSPATSTSGAAQSAQVPKEIMEAPLGGNGAQPGNPPVQGNNAQAPPANNNAGSNGAGGGNGSGEGEETPKKMPSWLFPATHFGDDTKSLNAFFNSGQAVSPLTQVSSVYNGASSSATVSANLVSMIFRSGWQGLVMTNIQAGSAATTTTTTQAVPPTLSATAAAQAAQNMLYGGTLAFAADFPLIFYGPHVGDAGGFGIEVDAVGREGIDIQNFASGTSTSVTSPPSHFASNLEGYMLYNAINQPANSTTGFSGSLFLGGSYGYDYTSHGYAREYGFYNRVHNDLGQVSAGILITGVAKIAVSRAFGPSQTYIDSATGVVVPNPVNNFKAWSIGITYQQKAPSSSSGNPPGSQ